MLEHLHDNYYAFYGPYRCLVRWTAMQHGLCVANNHSSEEEAGEDWCKTCKTIVWCTVKQLFVCYNTCPPSSAPAEKLFSSASLVLTKRQNKLGDKLFEKLTKLKINQNYWWLRDELTDSKRWTDVRCLMTLTDLCDFSLLAIRSTDWSDC